MFVKKKLVKETVDFSFQLEYNRGEISRKEKGFAYDEKLYFIIRQSFKKRMDFTSI